MLVRVELSRVIINEMDDRQAIYLREVGGTRIFPIIIGFNEAYAIDRKVKDQAVPRPMTHDLLDQTIRALDGKLDRVIVNDLKDGTFFAKLVVKQGERTIEIDSRPSDAIALSVRADAPIYIEESVLDQVNATTPPCDTED